MEKRVLAFDFGASSGRAIIGKFENGKIELEEVHRFSIEYHRSRRKKASVSTTLTSIEGIGESRGKALLKHFKTMKAIAAASVEELEEYIRPCGLYHVKSQNTKDACAMLVDEYDGIVPDTMCLMRWCAGSSVLSAVSATVFMWRNARTRDSISS